MSNVEFRPEIKDGSPEDDATVEKKSECIPKQHIHKRVVVFG